MSTLRDHINALDYVVTKYREMLKQQRKRIEELEADLRIANISVEAMAEVKASVDADSDQPIEMIVYHAIGEIRALTKDNTPEQNTTTSPLIGKKGSDVQDGGEA